MGQIYVKSHRKGTGVVKAHSRSVIVKLSRTRKAITRAQKLVDARWCRPEGWIPERRLRGLLKTEAALKTKLTSKFDKVWRYRLERGRRTGSMRIHLR